MSKFSEKMKPDLCFTVPGGPPRDVTAEAVNSTAIVVRWRAIAEHLSYGNVRGYQVAYIITDALTSRSQIINTYEGELGKIASEETMVSFKKLLFYYFEKDYILGKNFGLPKANPGPQTE